VLQAHLLQDGRAPETITLIIELRLYFVVMSMDAWRISFDGTYSSTRDIGLHCISKYPSVHRTSKQPMEHGLGVPLGLEGRKVAVTDSPYAKTKEQSDGILVLEARDLNHAIQLISQHPEVKCRPLEICPAAHLNEIIKESKRRRGKDIAR
jgi:hypothetical protein